MPNRFENLNNNGHRYGYQGQEKDDEIKGEGNSLNYTFRMHDPRVGRFFAIDPLSHKYPHYTPFSFSGNKVIESVELEGAEEKIVWYVNKSEKPTTLLKLSDKNTNWPSAQIANYNIVKSLDDAGLVTWSYGKGQYYQSNRTDGSMYYKGNSDVWNGPSRGTLIIREVKGKFIVAYDSKSLSLKQNKESYSTLKIIKDAFDEKKNPEMVKGINTSKNYVAGVSLAVSAPAVLAGQSGVVGTLGAISDVDQLTGISSNLTEGSQTTSKSLNYFKAIISVLSMKKNIDDVFKFNLIDSKNATSVFPEAITGTASTVTDIQEVVIQN